MDYVIIGNGAAGVEAAIAICERDDRRSRVTIISDEIYPFYSRPLITDYLAEQISQKALFHVGRSFYRKRRMKTRLGQKAVELDAKSCRVVLANGERIPYDQLLIATGASPVFPNILGISKRGITGLRTLDDVKAIKEVIKKARQAVVIGGGLIGMKATQALLAGGLKVSVVVNSNHLMSQVLDEKAAGIGQNILERKDARIFLKQNVEEIYGDQSVQGVILTDGTEIPCELVIVGKGIKPNSDLAKAAGLKINRGIVANDHLETSLKDVYTAGDCAETYNIAYGEDRLSPTWPNAREQGRIAGLNMAGANIQYSGNLNMNAVNFGDISFIALGITSPKGAPYETFVNNFSRDYAYKKIVLKNNVIVGAIFIGEIERAGIITGLIKDRVNVKNFKKAILEKGFGFAYLPSELRKKKLSL